MNRRDFAGHLVGGALLAGTAFTLEGCSALDNLMTWIPVGIAAFDGVAAVVDGPFVTIAGIVDAEWLAVSKAIDLYNHSTDPMQTRLDRVIAVMDALAGGLTQALAALPVSIPAAVLTASKAILALTIATLKSIRDRLQPPLPAPQAVYSAAGAAAPATSTNDYKSKVNKIWTDAGMQPLVK